MTLASNKDWLVDHRDIYIKNIVKDFFKSFDFFQELDSNFSKNGLSYEGMDKWVGTQEAKGMLWQLKDMSHLMWKDAEPQKNPDPFLFDWMIGTLFHEAMKLKENLYVLMHYRPVYQTLQLPQNKNRSEDTCPMFFQEINDEVYNSIKRIRCLYEKALNKLYAITANEKDNALLIRFILDQKDENPNGWERKNGIGSILRNIFPNNMDEAYCIAGESYLEGSWYTEAKNAFEQALKINPNCREAKSALRILEKRLNEIALLLEKEYTLQLKNGHKRDIK